MTARCSLVVATLLTATFFVATAFAANSVAAPTCECTEPTVEKAYEDAELIVVGTATSIMAMAGGAGTMAFIKTGEDWKQKAGKQIVVTTAGACAFPWQAGESYLLFVTKGKNSLFSTELCRGNMKEADASAAVQWLEEND